VKSQPSFGVILGGGISLGLTFLGIVRAFEERGYYPTRIGGCSVGAAVGAAWAAGLPYERMAEAAEMAAWRRFVRPVVGKQGLFSFYGFTRFIEQICGVKLVEELPVPLSIFATNLTTSKAQVFRQGPLGQTVAASCSIPGIFAPVKLGGELYADGGLIRGNPVDILNDADDLDFVVVLDPVGDFEFSGKPRNTVEVLLRSFLILLKSTGRYLPEECAFPLIRIAPHTGGVNPLNLHELPQLEPRGYAAAQEALEEYESWFEKGPP